MVGAAAASPLAARNQTPVTRNVRRTPTASMIGPAMMPATADVARNAVMTQGSRATSPRSSAIAGSATLTTVPSSSVSPDPRVAAATIPRAVGVPQATPLTRTP